MHDAAIDTRFRNNPFVVSEPHIRFYAGAPLLDPEGYTLGTICVIDHEPRTLADNQLAALRIIGRQAQALIERHFFRQQAAAAGVEQARLRGMLDSEHHRLDAILAVQHIGWFESDAGTGALSSGGRFDDLLATGGRAPPRDLPALIECAHREDRVTLAAAFAAIRATGRPFSTTFRVARADGQQHWIACNVHAEHDAEMRRLYGILSDVTVQTRLLQRLERKAALLETVNDFVPLALAYVSADRRVLWSNRRNARRHGLDIIDIVGMTLDELLTPVQFDEASAFVQKALDGKKSVRKTVIEANDGTATHWETHLLPHKHIDGRPAGYIMVCREISATAAAGVSPTEGRHQYWQLLDEVPAMIWRADAFGELRFINSAFREFTGEPPHVLLGSGWEHFVHPEDSLQGLDQRRAAIAEGRAFAVELNLRDAEGQYRRVLDRAAPVRDAEGHLVGYAGVCVELPATASEIRAQMNNQLAQRAAVLTAQVEIDRWSAMIAHDLRAPLRAISGFSTILEEDYGKVLPAGAATHLQLIRRNTARINDMIAGMLRLAQISRVELIRTEFEPAALVNEVIEDFAEELATRNISIRVELPPACRGDRLLLRQVFHNLFSNAFKYTRNCAAPSVEISGYESETTYHFAVTDNGCGFNPAYAQKLFNLFSRAHSAQEFPGVGVGLAIVKRIVERHGGTVSGAAAAAGGAHFRFTLAKTVFHNTDQAAPQC